MSIFKQPKAPNPMQTAAAQSASNTSTALAQQLLNQTSQVTPYGNLNYSQSGTVTYTDPSTGQTTTLPRFTATQTLSPAQQALLEQEQAFDKEANATAIDQMGRVRDTLGQPLDLSNDAVEGRLMELGRKRLDPMWAERESAFDAKMANSGVAPGSEAYARARREFDAGKNDAYTNLLLQGRAQSVNELLTQRNAPINEATALMSAGQVQQPMFSNTPQVGVQGTDVAGLIQSNYAQQLASRNAALGGLAGLGGAVLGGWAQNGFATSDRKAKKGVKKIGKLSDLGLYSYRMRGENGPRQIGVMADEVDDVMPEAVGIDPKTGMRMVNYGRLAQAMAPRYY